MSSPISEDLSNQIQDFINQQIATGFYASDEIIQSAVDVLMDDTDDVDEEVLRAFAARMISELFSEQFIEQMDWPVVTDCDRLARAFEELERNGIISRQNFSCCGNCGCAEIGDEIEKAEGTGINARGYTFYHMQDTENAVANHNFHLNYGALQEGEEAALSIAGEIVATLNKHEIKTHWDGTWRTRIGVSLDWKKRIAIAS